MGLSLFLEKRDPPLQFNITFQRAFTHLHVRIDKSLTVPHSFLTDALIENKKRKKNGVYNDTESIHSRIQYSSVRYAAATLIDTSVIRVFYLDELHQKVRFIPET